MPGEPWTVILAIDRSYEGVLAGTSPVMRRRHASWHSWIISVAYFLFLASPEKANAFSGFPSATQNEGG